MHIANSIMIMSQSDTAVYIIMLQLYTIGDKPSLHSRLPALKKNKKEVCTTQYDIYFLV